MFILLVIVCINSCYIRLTKRKRTYKTTYVQLSFFLLISVRFKYFGWSENINKKNIITMNCQQLHNKKASTTTQCCHTNFKPMIGSTKIMKIYVYKKQHDG